jgi:hypothetical protein
VKDVEIEIDALKEAFAKKETPLGWFFAGMLSNERERFDFLKKSAEGGCSWGQVYYGWYFFGTEFVEEDEKVYVEWLEKAASQNNPEAMDWLGDWFRTGGDEDDKKAVSFYRAAAELGLMSAMESLAGMLRVGAGCKKDLRRAAIWGAQGFSNVFRRIFDAAEMARDVYGRDEKVFADLGCDFHQLCYALGWGFYWYLFDTAEWDAKEPLIDEEEWFASNLLYFYCSCVELQQKSIFTFLWWWNQTVGVKDVGRMIAQMVWEGREENLVQPYLWLDELEEDWYGYKSDSSC